MVLVSKVSQDDTQHIVDSSEITWKDIKNSTVFITGATGLIGSSLVHTLSLANSKHNLDMRIIAHGRDKIKGKALTRNYRVEFISSDVRSPFSDLFIADKLDYIFHCAAITKSADMVIKPIDVITTAIDGTRNVMELAREKQCKSVVYVSSMEIYGQTTLEEVTETDLGYIDLTNPRSCYPESKRLCEIMCVCYYKQHHVPVKIARLAQTFGAGTSKNDSRVFAQFARSAIASENIVLHTEGKSRGNYCYISDTIRGLILLLLEGGNGEAYNIANPDASATIQEMAELVANKVCAGKVSVIIDIPSDIAERGYAPNVGFRLNVNKMKSIGWEPKYNLIEMYKRMITEWTDNI